MKKLIALVSLVVFSLVGFSQELENELNTLNIVLNSYEYEVKDGTIVMQKIVEVPEATSQQLYSMAKNFVISIYNSPNNVIQNDDLINGHLIVKGLFESSTCNCGNIVFAGSGMEYTASHILKFDVKDGKIRITVIANSIKQKSGGTQYFPLKYIDYSVTQLYPISKNLDVFSNNHYMNWYAKDGSRKQYQGFIHEGYVLYNILKSMKGLLILAESNCNNMNKIENEDNW